MQIRRYVVIGIELLFLIGGLIAVVAFATNQLPTANKAVEGQSSQPSNQLPAAIATATAPAPTATPYGAEVTVGQSYDRPYAKSPFNIKVVRVADPSLVSKEEATQALIAQLGADPSVRYKNAKLATLTYGAVTEGFLTPNGAWSGERNLQVKTCTTRGVCTATSEVLDHLENRLMWVFDYSGVVIPSSGQSCTANASKCVPLPDHDHAVYLLDAKTLQLWLGTDYSSVLTK